jgi:hypothetical protein
VYFCGQGGVFVHEGHLKAILGQQQGHVTGRTPGAICVVAVCSFKLESVDIKHCADVHLCFVTTKEGVRWAAHV